MAMSALAPQAMTRIADTQALQSSNMQAEAVAKHEIQTQMQQAKAAAGALLSDNMMQQPSYRCKVYECTQRGWVFRHR